MTNKFNYTTRIVVIIAILALLLGFILGGIFAIVNNDYDDDSNVIVSDYSHGHYMDSGPVLLSEIEYSTSSGHGHNTPIVDPWQSVDPINGSGFTN